MLPCSEGECNNYVWISITMQNILYQLDCACYYKIRQTIVLILRPSEHSKTSTSKRYISRSTCLKFNLKTVLNSDNHGGSNSRTAALIITLAKSVLSPLAAPLCTALVSGQVKNLNKSSGSGLAVEYLAVVFITPKNVIQVLSWHVMCDRASLVTYCIVGRCDRW